MSKHMCALTTILHIRNHSLIRRCASGRFPGRGWDGPTLKLAEGACAEPRMHRAYKKVKSRGTSINNHWRDVFLKSCCPGSHPIHRRAALAVQDEEHGDKQRQNMVRSPAVQKFLEVVRP